MAESLNLDLRCAKFGFCIATDVIEATRKSKESKEPLTAQEKAKGEEKAATSAENLITRMLGVLQSQGIYATFLLLEAKKEAGSIPLRARCVELIQTVTRGELGKPEEILRTLEKPDGILSSLPTLLLVKRVMEQTLTYARYHAKAAGEKAKAGATHA